MESKTNKILLVYLFLCIKLFNSAHAICVPRNQSVLEGSLSVSSPHPASAPKTQPPASSPSSSTGRAPVPSGPPKSQTPPSSSSTTAYPPSPSTSMAPESPPSGKGKGKGNHLSFLNNLPKSQVTLPFSLDMGTENHETDPQVKSLCDKTDHPEFCLALVAPFLDGKSDILSVVEKLIKAGTQQTKAAISAAEKMSKEPQYNNPWSALRFKDCKDMYDDALDNMQEAIDAIADKDIGTIQTMISATISDFSSCDDGFTGQPNPIPDGVSPMLEINKFLMNISDIILTLAMEIP